VSEPLTLEPRGPFSLAAAGFAFGPGQGRTPAFDGAMRLAFPIDGGEGYAGVVARQPLEHGPVRCEVHGGGDLALVERQIARVLSLDHDAFLSLGERDRLIGERQRRHPGQRPVLFHSPYEAAAWSVISARRQPAQAAAVRRGLGVALGQTFELAGRQVVAFPQAERLPRRSSWPGSERRRASACVRSQARRSRVRSTWRACTCSGPRRPGAPCKSCRASAPSTPA
jgi:DNA-3-methyladenine glycosylase II